MKHIKHIKIYENDAWLKDIWIKNIQPIDITFKHKIVNNFNVEKINIPSILTGRSTIRYKYVTYPKINNGNVILEFHIELISSLQGKGLALKIIKSFLFNNNRGKDQCLWIAYNKIINNFIYNIISKAKNDPDLLVIEYNNGVTIQKAKNR